MTTLKTKLQNITAKIKKYLKPQRVLQLLSVLLGSTIWMVPLVFCAVSLIMIAFSYARFAWLATALILLTAGLYFLEICLKKVQYKANKQGNKFFEVAVSIFYSSIQFFIRFLSFSGSKGDLYKGFLKLGRALFYMAFVLLSLVGVFAINLPPSAYDSFPINLLPTSVTKPSSNFFHAMRTFASIEVLNNNPDKFLLGYGLGISGPSAKMSYYNIKEQALFRDNEAVAYRYRLVGEDLTIPENWYIQTIFNGGIFYAIVYLILASYPFWQVGMAGINARNKYNNHYKNENSELETGFENSLENNLETVLENNSDGIKLKSQGLQAKYSKFKKGLETKKSFDTLNFVFENKLAVTGFAGVLLGNLFLHIFESSTVFGYFALTAMLIIALFYNHSR